MSDLDNFNKFEGVFCKEFLINKKEFSEYLKDGFNNENFKSFLKANDLNDKRLIFQEQKHSNNVKLIDKNILKERDVILNNDAMITKKRSLYLCTYTADCVPAIFFDPGSRAIGIAHSGWEGTLNLIAQKAIRMMHESFGICYNKLKCYLGSSIKDCCYEISKAEDNRVENFVNQFGSDVIRRDKDKIYLNLHKAIKIQLKETGVLEKNIEISPYCTCCNNKPELPSYYRDGKEYEKSILSIIGIKK